MGTGLIRENFIRVDNLFIELNKGDNLDCFSGMVGMSDHSCYNR